MRKSEGQDGDQCRWVENADGYWDTTCLHAFEFTTGDPGTDGMYYCPYCGGELEQVDYEEGRDG